MKRRAILLLMTMGAALVLSSGVALAITTIQCSQLRFYCYGTTGDDRMLGADNNNGMHGYGGNDVLRGFGGSDDLLGHEGDDRLFGGSNEGWWDTLDGGEGDDTLRGASGDDRLTGGMDADTLFGGLGDDSLDPGGDDDSSSGGPGDDRYNFVSGSFYDWVYASWDHDTITDTDTVPDGDPETGDWAELLWVRDDLTIDLSPSEDRPEVTTADGKNTVDWSGDAVDNVRSGYGDDTIRGNDAANTIDASWFDPREDGSGDHTGVDTVFAGGGDDLVRVEDGIDYYQDDRVDCGKGHDTVVFNRGDKVKHCEVEHLYWFRP